MLVYLGGAIDLVKEGERTQWRNDFKKVLGFGKISTFDPAAAFNYFNDNDTAKRLIQINKEALLNCDAAVFVMAPDKPSIGTPIELWLANENKIPNIVIWSGDMNNLPAYIDGLAGSVVDSLEKAKVIITAWHSDKKARAKQ